MGGNAVPTSFEMEQFYYIQRLEQLLLDHGIDTPPHPYQCYMCPLQATWTMGEGEWHLADYCDRHIGVARKTFARDNLTFRQLPATHYFQESIRRG